MIIQNRAEESETSGEEYVSNRRRHHSVSSYASQADRGQVPRPRAPSSDERHEGGGEPDDDWEISDDEVDDAEDVNASKKSFIGAQKREELEQKMAWVPDIRLECPVPWERAKSERLADCALAGDIA
ncbi:hypothetical protein FOZ63_011366 [Perkinsus olseni]|uniref:Uncharacterized protein n=1 Tax=Perkinsus olseni TaxID=32597 RepID=A0A7J6UEZ8_PEROL|nr:hypothetical protein FOZ63_011366 [Perkinsus olseni]KAF4755777.1 hypothetical protein FOZ62_004623 [Perkinsus olseni]